MAGICSEGLRSTNESPSERARKGFGIRAKGLRSKWQQSRLCFVYMFYFLQSKTQNCITQTDVSVVFTNIGVIIGRYIPFACGMKEGVFVSKREKSDIFSLCDK